MAKFVVVGSYADSLINFRGDWLKYLIDNGYEVHACAPELEDGSEVHNRLIDLGVTPHSYPVRRAGVNPFGDLLTLWVLFRIFRKIKPDFAMFYTIKPVVYGVLAAFLARVPKRIALITGLGYAFHEERKRSVVAVVASFLYKQAIWLSGVVFFQNPDDQRLFLERKLLANKERSCVVNGSGINTSQFQIEPLPCVPRFLMIGRFLGDKGVREYAAASLLLKDQYPDAEFSLVGWIDENPDAISPAELDSWVDSGINYLGKLDDVRPSIADALVYVLPSYREGTPRTVLEAMSMGRPVITTDAPGCRETVVDGENGFLVPVKSVEALAEAMKAFIVDPSLAAKMGQKSREIAVNKYDVNSVNQMMLEKVR